MVFRITGGFVGIAFLDLEAVAVAVVKEHDPSAVLGNASYPHAKRNGPFKQRADVPDLQTYMRQPVRRFDGRAREKRLDMKRWADIIDNRNRRVPAEQRLGNRNGN